MMDAVRKDFEVFPFGVAHDGVMSRREEKNGQSSPERTDKRTCQELETSLIEIRGEEAKWSDYEGQSARQLTGRSGIPRASDRGDTERDCEHHDYDAGMETADPLGKDGIHP